MLRRVFGPKREEVIQGRRKCHNECRQSLLVRKYFRGEQPERSVKGGECSPMRKLTHFIKQCYAAGKVTNGRPFIHEIITFFSTEQTASDLP